MAARHYMAAEVFAIGMVVLLRPFKATFIARQDRNRAVDSRPRQFGKGQ